MHLRLFAEHAVAQRPSLATAVRRNCQSRERKTLCPTTWCGDCRAFKWPITLLSLHRLLSMQTTATKTFLARPNTHLTAVRAPTRIEDFTRVVEVGTSLVPNQFRRCRRLQRNALCAHSARYITFPPRRPLRRCRHQSPKWGGATVLRVRHAHATRHLCPHRSQRSPLAVRRTKYAVNRMRHKTGHR